MPQLSVQTRSISELRLNPNNARVHSARQIAQLKRSISAFGFVNPALIDCDGNVVAGHGRIVAAQALGWKEVPTIALDHLTPAQLKAYHLADNKLAECADWNKKLLAEQLLELSSAALDFSIELTGFSTGEIDVLIGDITTDDQEVDPPLPDDTGEPPISRTGDVWILGRHRLLCGDALEEENYERLLQGQPAQMIFTDPPWNVPVDGHVSGKGKTKHREFAMASGEMTEVEFTQFLRSATGLMADHSDDGSVHFICIDWRHASQLQQACSKVYTSLLNICVWNKSNAGMGSLYRSAHEFFLVLKSGRAPHINNVKLGSAGRHRTNIWSYPSANSMSRNSDEGRLLDSHPTPKPVKLCADAILDCSERNGTVLDPFTGSGSTLIAAERTGRVFRGMEIDATYCDLAIRRWQSMTGEQAVHEDSGRNFTDMSNLREAVEEVVDAQE